MRNDNKALILSSQHNTNTILLSGFCFGVASSLSTALLPSFVKNYLRCNIIDFGDMNGIILAVSFFMRSVYMLLIETIIKPRTLFKISIVLLLIGKFFIGLSFSIFMIFVAKIIDRIAKGMSISTINFILSVNMQNKNCNSYAKYEAFYTSGVLVGLFIVRIICKICLTNELTYRFMFLLSIPFLLIAYYLACCISAKDENININQTSIKQFNIKQIKDKMTSLPLNYWLYTLFIFCLTLCYYDIGFIQYRACQLSVDQKSIASCYLMYHMAIIISSIASIRINKIFGAYKLFFFGIILLIIANAIGIFTCNKVTIMLVYICGGVHYGLIRSITYSSLSKYVSQDLYTVSFSIFYIVEAIALFISNIMAGRFGNVLVNISLHETIGPFILGLIVSSLTLFILVKNKRIHDN